MGTAIDSKAGQGVRLAVGLDVKTGDDERDGGGGLVGDVFAPAVVIAEHFAVVGGEDD